MEELYLKQPELYFIKWYWKYRQERYVLGANNCISSPLDNGKIKLQEFSHFIVGFLIFWHYAESHPLSHFQLQFFLSTKRKKVNSQRKQYFYRSENNTFIISHSVYYPMESKTTSSKKSNKTVGKETLFASLTTILFFKYWFQNSNLRFIS